MSAGLPVGLATSVGAVAADDQQSKVLSAEEFAGIVTGARGADLAGVTVEGDLDLRDLESIARPFRCRSCRFTGAFIATDLIFERIVDLSGSVFEAPADFSAAIFEDRAGLEGARFAESVTFGLTRFLSGASLAGVEFGESAAFERARFGGDAGFEEAAFASEARFEAAQFDERADFAGASFAAAADFSATGFAERASFVRAEFGRVADFGGATMADGANLGANVFRQGLMLVGVTAGGLIEFPGAVLFQEGFFVNLSSTGSLVLDGMSLHPEAELFMDGLAVDRLILDVERQVDFVQGPAVKTRVLELVERTGRESGDLALANRARFRLLDMQGARKEGLDRVVDRLIFRDVGGYLVRPLNPIIALLSLIMAGGLIRSARPLGDTLRNWWPASASGGDSLNARQVLRRVLLTLEKATARILAGIAAAMRVAVKRKADHIELGDPERTREYLMVGVLWCEFLVYKLVFATIVLALGNSNSAVRQLLDAVTG